MECDVRNDRHFFELIRDFSHAKKAYEKLQSALEDVEKTGYGIVRPQLSEMQLKNPEMFRQGNRYGVKIKATAPSLHMIRTDITTEVSPIVGSENQSRISSATSADNSGKIPSISGRRISSARHCTKWSTIRSTANSAVFRRNFSRKIRRSLQKISDEGKEYFICIII